MTYTDKIFPQFAHRQVYFDKKERVGITNLFEIRRKVKVCYQCSGVGKQLPNDIRERIHDDREESVHKTPWMIRRIQAQPKFLKDLIALGRMICSISRHKKLQHWRGIGDFKMFSNQGTFGYYFYYKDNERKTDENLTPAEKSLIINCIKWLQTNNHLYK